jgi:hypothetical protein
MPSRAVPGPPRSRLAGLLDQNLLAGNAQALTVVTAMAAWVKARTDRLTHAQMQVVLQTEFGGMNEVLTNLFQVTGNPDTSREHADPQDHRRRARVRADPDPALPRHRDVLLGRRHTAQT